MTAKAWHFVADTLRDGRPVPPDGEWLEHDGLVSLCVSGLHASREIIDALGYALGDTMCRVECDGVEDEDEDKLVCRRRRILWRVDGERLLADFARRCALDVIHLWDAPDVVVRYLRTGDAALRGPAEAAAREGERAAEDNGRDVAEEAARATVWAVNAARRIYAGQPARSASAAVRNAALATYAIRDATRTRQNRRLTAMVSAARKEAA